MEKFGGYKAEVKERMRGKGKASAEKGELGRVFRGGK